MSAVNRELTISIASVPDRDDLVAELWSGDTQVAELSREHGRLTLEVYQPHAAGAWTLSYEDFVGALGEMRRRLDA